MGVVPDTVNSAVTAGWKQARGDRTRVVQPFPFKEDTPSTPHAQHCHAPSPAGGR